MLDFVQSNIIPLANNVAFRYLIAPFATQVSSKIESFRVFMKQNFTFFSSLTQILKIGTF